MAASNYYVGIDLGGTKIEIIALSHDGQEAFRQRRNTPQASSTGQYISAAEQYVAIIATIKQLITACEQHLNFTCLAVGIGIPGALSLQTGLIKNANTTCLIGQDLMGDLARQLNKQVRLENDANCFVLSEATDGSAQHASIVFGVILGTGVGGGFVMNNKLLIGANAITGEWGHNPLTHIGPQDLPMQTCYCGRQGCIETYLSGPGCAMQTKLEKFNDINDLATPHLTSQDIMQQQSPAAIHAYQRYIDRLARGLASVINIIDPDIIVLGGGLSNVDSLYVDVPKIWGKYIFSDGVATRLLKHKHGDSSGVRGAAYLTRQ